MGLTIHDLLANLRDRTSRLSEVLGLDEDASIAAVVYFFLVLMLSLFCWIGLGVVVDRMSAIGTTSALDSTMFPVSQNRIDTLTMLGLAYRWIPWLGGVFPLLVYTFVVAKRRQSGSVP
jgi:hypothetical protein